MFSFILSSALISACPWQSDLLLAASDKIEKHYVIADSAKTVASDIRKWRNEGRYVELCQDRAAFLKRFNADLDRIDGHFFVEETGGSGGSSNDWLMAWRRSGQTAGQGIRHVQVLEKNIGYIRIASFYPWAQSAQKYAAAFALLDNVDGYIIDLRGNGGGDPESAMHLVAAFAAEVQSVQTVEGRMGMRGESLPQRSPFKIDPAKRVAILTDRRSASASEYVAYSLQALKRATVIGSPTAGVAHMIGEPVDLGQGFAISIPHARPVNLITGSNWEGVGVTPDVNGGDDPLFFARQYLSDHLERTD